MRVHVLALALLVHAGAEAASRRTFVSFGASDIRPSFSFDKAYETGPMLNLTGVLTVPEARGRVAAIVHLHGCSGAVRSLDEFWTARFVEWGYAVLRLDSLSPRGLTNVCVSDAVSPYSRAADAYAAKAWLGRQPEIDADRIAVAGWSHGGSTVLKALGFPPGDFGADPTTEPFRGGIAFYPWCERPNAILAPLLILAGEADTWTPAESCRELRGMEKVRVEFYPNATHGFDAPGADLIMLGHRIRYQPEAAAAATQAVRTFLAEIMRESPHTR